MSIELVVSLIAAVLGAGSAVAVTSLSIRSRRVEARDQRELSARLIREPLGYAASDLQSRMWRIASGGFSGLNERDHHGRDYFRVNTAFVVAQYFGWTELLRRRVVVGDQKAHFDRELWRALEAVQIAFAEADAGAFLVLPGEQRAIGELMLHEHSDADSYPVVGYAEFAARYADDEVIRRWMASVAEGTDRVLSGDVPVRVVRIQRALIDVMELLDPSEKYTPRSARTKLSQ